MNNHSYACRLFIPLLISKQGLSPLCNSHLSSSFPCCTIHLVHFRLPRIDFPYLYWSFLKFMCDFQRLVFYLCTGHSSNSYSISKDSEGPSTSVPVVHLVNFFYFKETFSISVLVIHLVHVRLPRNDFPFLNWSLAQFIFNCQGLTFRFCTFHSSCSFPPCTCHLAHF